ncbi:MAG: uroporphyrinogen-III C-methyltransferase [Bacteroidota bacterium]
MPARTSSPHVTLVGAGPGAPDLISIRGAKALAQADAVLYDALTHPDLLELAPEKAVKVYVGKRAGQPRLAQEEINRLIVEHAFNYGHVVRLKGGDPFVFGRGSEEISHIHAFNIPTEVVPGISSMNSVPGLQGIPLTQRGVNQSFWVITGTTAQGTISEDIFMAARTNATVVVLMGLRKIQQIMRVFARMGKGQVPVAVIQSGSLPEENIALGTVQTIEREVKRLAVGGPAIMVIGEVVRQHPYFSHIAVQEYGGEGAWRER